MYFAKFPLIYYDFNIGNKLIMKPMKDITINVRLRNAILENITLFDEYDIQDGETPEIVAAKVYGNPEYHWVVMLCNQKFDYLEDFPKTTRVLEQYVADKYDSPYATRHWVNEQGMIVTQTTLGARPVTYYEYEDQLNESKRRIKLISPEMLLKVITQFKALI